MTFKWTNPEDVRLDVTEFREEPGKLVIRVPIVRNRRLETLFCTGRYTLEILDQRGTFKEVDYIVISAEVCFLLQNSLLQADAHLTLDTKKFEEKLF